MLPREKPFTAGSKTWANYSNGARHQLKLAIAWDLYQSAVFYCQFVFSFKAPRHLTAPSLLFRFFSPMHSMIPPRLWLASRQREPGGRCLQWPGVGCCAVEEEKETAGKNVKRNADRLGIHNKSSSESPRGLTLSGRLFFLSPRSPPDGGVRFAGVTPGSCPRACRRAGRHDGRRLSCRETAIWPPPRSDTRQNQYGAVYGPGL